MKLEMYLDEELLDTIPLGRGGLKITYATHIKPLKDELLKKHQSLLLKAAGKPCFILSGVPSCMNNFVPLTHFVAEQKVG